MDFLRFPMLCCGGFEPQSMPVKPTLNKFHSGPAFHPIGLAVAHAVTHDVTCDATCDVTRDVTHDVTHDVTCDVTHDATCDVTRDVTRDVTHDVTRDVTHDVTRDVTHDVTHDVTRDVTYAATHDVMHDVMHAATHAATDTTHQPNNLKNCNICLTNSKPYDFGEIKVMNGCICDYDICEDCYNIMLGRSENNIYRCIMCRLYYMPIKNGRPIPQPNGQPVSEPFINHVVPPLPNDLPVVDYARHVQPVVRHNENFANFEIHNGRMLEENNAGYLVPHDSTNRYVIAARGYRTNHTGQFEPKRPRRCSKKGKTSKKGTQNNITHRSKW
jgi:hypothetical protein